MPTLPDPPLTVLAIDDDPTVVRLLRLVLPAHGLTLTVAEDGPAGVESYRQARADVVVLDVTMQPWDGPQTLAELRAIDPDVRAVFISGAAGGPDDDRLLALGATGVIPKPFPPFSELVARVREAAGPVATSPSRS